MPGNSSISLSSSLASPATRASVDEHTAGNTHHAGNAHAHRSWGQFLMTPVSYVFSAAKHVLGHVGEAPQGNLNHTSKSSDLPANAPADKPERFTSSIQDDAQSGVHIPPPSAQRHPSRTTEEVSIPDTKETPDYWRSFSLEYNGQCKTNLLTSSIKDLPIIPWKIREPVYEQTFVNLSGNQCVRNPMHELRLHADSSIILHGHSNVFAKIDSSRAGPVKRAQTSQLALAQSPDDTSNGREPKMLQRILSSSDVHPGNNPLVNRNPGNDWLLYALQSNRSSMVQFVSRNSHVAGSNGKEVPLLTQLKAQLEKAAATGGEVKLDEHNTLVAIDHETDADQWKGGQHVVGLKTATLTVKVQQNGAEEFKTITLTQVAPPFENRLLKAEHLRIVYDICKDSALDLDQTVVFSYAGMGRNATLAVYDQLMRAIENGHITNATELDQSMRELVKSGRSVHHQNFVQSDEQLAQLFSAAYRSLIEKHPDAAIQTSSRAADQNEQDRAHINQLASTIMRNVVAATEQQEPDDDANSLDGHESEPLQMEALNRASSRRSSFSDSGSYNSGRNSASNSQALPPDFMRFYSGQNTPAPPEEDILYTRGLMASSSDSGSRIHSPSTLDIQAALHAAFDVGTDRQTPATTDGLPLTPVQSEEETPNAASAQPLFFNDDIASRGSTPRVSENGVDMNSEPARASRTLHPQRA